MVMLDPPRAGLSRKALDLILTLTNIIHIVYLSCNPEALVRDIEIFVKNKWNIERVIPFDFFPKTKHLETLVVLNK